MTRDAARDVEKVLSSAVANAETNHGLDGDELYVSVATVGAGPTLKRWRARARGRVARIKKRTCHITIALALPADEAIPATISRPAPAAAPAPEPEAEAETPKRVPRKKAETAETATATEEKPKRAPRKKAAADSKAEEKPRPRRAAKPKAEKPPAENAKQKTTRKKKAEDS
jgi:large subunit ribosomal protein L22